MTISLEPPAPEQSQRQSFDSTPGLSSAFYQNESSVPFRSKCSALPPTWGFGPSRTHRSWCFRRRSPSFSSPVRGRPIGRTESSLVCPPKPIGCEEAHRQNFRRRKCFLLHSAPGAWWACCSTRTLEDEGRN